MTTIQQAPAALKTASPAVHAKRLGLAAVIALVLNLIAYAVASAADATWIANDMPIGWYMVVFATIFPIAIGAGVTVLLARRWAQAPRVMAWVGLALALVSVPMPFLASSDDTTSIALASMHAITGIAWFAGILPRRTSVNA